MLKKVIYTCVAGCTFTMLSYAADEKPNNSHFPWLATFHTHAVEASLGFNQPIDITPLVQLLEEVRPSIEGVVPSQQDFAVVMNFLEPYLLQLQNASDDDFQETVNQCFQALRQLFYTDVFTLEQKAALFAILENFASSLSTQS